MDKNETVCFCVDVTKGDIIDAIEKGAKTYEDLQAVGIAPNGCCKNAVLEILEECK